MASPIYFNQHFPNSTIKYDPNMIPQYQELHINSVENGDHIHQDAITPLSPTPLTADGLLQLQQQQDQQHSSQPPSFETILSGLSTTPYSRVSFMNFCKNLHCSENLEFLINSNQYLLTDNDLEKSQIWQYIHQTFITSDSPKEVNIPYELKRNLIDHEITPSNELVVETMCVIKDLLRDVHLQFISSVKREQLSKNSSQISTREYFDRINENYSLLPTPTENNQSHIKQLSSFENRRMSEVDPTSPNLNTRCISPLSNSELNYSNNLNLLQNDNGTSTTTFVQFGQISKDPHNQNGVSYKDQPVLNSDSSSSLDDISGKTIILSKTSNKSGSTSSLKKNSFSDSTSTNFKKFTDKFKWRRLSSNSSTASN